jgi:succinate dehydrogenase/fumarate reductase flavoprotein subunit
MKQTAEPYSVVSADVLVVGGGGAASRAAVEASKSARTVIAVDGLFGRAGTTTTGMGGMNVALGNFDAQDNWRVHYEDTIRGGQYLNNQELVEIFAKEGIDRIYDLEEYGMLFSRMPDGRIVQRRESGSTYNRTCMTGDRTGHELQRTLAHEVRRRNIPVYEDTIIAKLLVTDCRITGALGLDFRRGEFVVFRCPAVVMGTGGCARMYEICSNARESAGDAFGIVLEAGGTLVDMEMVQFHPTGMVFPDSVRGLLVSEAVRGDGGQLINSLGERFMLRYSPDWKELATRDVVSRSIWREVQEGRGTAHGGVFLDISHVPAAQIEERLPAMLKQLLRTGIDIRKEPMEVLPTPHFMCGGIKIDVQGASTVPGLFSGGEAAGGVHGANRLGANSFADLQVFGARAGASAAQYAAGHQSSPDSGQVEKAIDQLSEPLRRSAGISPIGLRKSLQKEMYQSVGIVRSAESIKSALQLLEDIQESQLPRMSVNPRRIHNQEWVEAIKLGGMVTAARAIAGSALVRQESRGVHYREDYPEKSQSWLVNINSRLTEGAMEFEKTPVVVSRSNPLFPSKS